MSGMEVGKELVDLCLQGKNVGAIETLDAADIVSIKARDMEGHEKQLNGIEAVRGKTQWWMENHDMHGGDIKDPFPHGDRFACYFMFDVTPKAGPMAGQRIHMEEVGLYTVKDGKIANEEFVHSMGRFRGGSRKSKVELRW